MSSNCECNAVLLLKNSLQHLEKECIIKDKKIKDLENRLCKLENKLHMPIYCFKESYD